MKKSIIIFFVCTLVLSTSGFSFAETMLNNPPSAPSISGTQNGKAGTSYDYTFSAVDPDGDKVYIYVEFCADCQEAKWHGPLASGEELTISHAWETKGTYTIRAKAKDSSEAESDWARLPVSMPKNKALNLPLLNRILEKIFFNFPIFQRLIG